jgi:hypothetical protein
MSLHAACNYYCQGTEHALLVTALPETSFEVFACWAATFQGRLRHAAPAEARPVTCTPDVHFDAETQVYTRSRQLPPGAIVWRLHIDFAEATHLPDLSALAHGHRCSLLRRAWGWVRRGRRGSTGG